MCFFQIVSVAFKYFLRVVGAHCVTLAVNEFLFVRSLSKVPSVRKRMCHPSYRLSRGNLSKGPSFRKRL